MVGHGSLLRRFPETLSANTRLILERLGESTQYKTDKSTYGVQVQVLVLRADHKICTRTPVLRTAQYSTYCDERMADSRFKMDDLACSTQIQ